jgi:hypothetical protein
MTEVVKLGPHKSGLSQDTLQHFAKEAAKKVAVGGKGYSVLLANCLAICSTIFVTSCHFLYGAERSCNLNGTIFAHSFIFE